MEEACHHGVKIKKAIRQEVGTHIKMGWQELNTTCIKAMELVRAVNFL